MQDLLNKWGVKIDYSILLTMWNESTRGYHTQNHLLNLIDKINSIKESISEKSYDKLMLCAIFHDIVYDPMRGDNEEKSAEFFINSCSDKLNSDILEVKQMILDTKTHQSNTILSETFNRFDMGVVEGGYDELLEWEAGIKFEYQGYGNEMYKIGRLQFLESLLDKYPQNMQNLSKLIDYVKTNY